jgi:hypothetical protein
LRIIRGKQRPHVDAVGALIAVARDLEKAVEDLSELLETPIEPEAIPTLRQRVTDKTVRRSIVGIDKER